MIKKLLLFKILIILVFSSALFGRERTFTFLKGQKTKIKNPFKLRDPFKRMEVKRKVRGKSGYFSDSNVFSNLPSIENVPLSQVRIVGVLLGRNRRAMAKIFKGGTPGKDTFILKEGMKLGEDKAEIKAILPGGIVLVEKIRNVYDQDEYLETIIPVSSD